MADVITEVEKLQAAQQLTSTLLPSSSVNVMSSKEGQCFLSQELGHIACCCPNICCFKCDEYGHIAVDCPDRIPPPGTHACHKGQSTNQRCHPDLHLCTITKTGIRIAGQGHSPILPDTTVIAKITHTGVIPGHITDTTKEALHNVATPALIITTVTHHTGDHPLIEVL